MEEGIWNVFKEIIKLDKYYKLPFFAGTLFTIFAIVAENIVFFKFGVVTFVFGVWFWMTGSGFHLKIKFSNTKKGKRNFLIMVSALILNSLFTFLAYVCLVCLILISI